MSTILFFVFLVLPVLALLVLWSPRKTDGTVKIERISEN